MSALEPDDFVEISQAGFDELRRPVFELSAVCEGQRINVWTGLSHNEAVHAARFWSDGGVQVVDLVVSESIH